MHDCSSERLDRVIEPQWTPYAHNKNVVALTRQCRMVLDGDSSSLPAVGIGNDDDGVGKL
ncbi:hypothetical protein DPMN_074245 [Dreissena polymorpha]|uniref:Uncharacterized protein n=1 Tax=Dreissena polymorpha TaxID=45954 RepID=A0A9D3YI18_DREPO|nr:hypothetical protein DPMN_074245 [Dreissena polymorpha]